MRYKTYRISFTVQGEERLGTVIGLLAGEANNIQINEVEAPHRRTNIERKSQASSPVTAKQRHDWAMGYADVILNALGSKAMYYKDVAVLVQKASSKKMSATSISPILSELLKAGKVVRVARGTYKAA